MNIAVIFAGGTGTRMHSKSKPKQFLMMQNKPIIIRTLEKFEYHDEIDAIVIACLEDWMGYLNDLISEYGISKVKKVVSGGATGQLSIYNGLKAAKEVAGDEDAVVLIHDGVRPLITEELISNNIATVNEKGSAITTVTVTETIMVVADDGQIDYIPDRAHSRLARAPQSFKLSEIIGLHERALAEGKDNFIDSCTMMQYYGKKLFLVDGPRENIKITTPDDFITMSALLDAWENKEKLEEM